MVALGLVTLEKLTVWLPVGAATLADLLSLNSPAVEVLTVQPEASPRLAGWDVRVEELAEKPEAGVQAPLGVVQAAKPTDFITVEDGTVKLNT